MRTRTKILGYLFILSIVTYMDRVCMSVAGPRIQADLGLSPSQWGWVGGAFTLGYALFEIPSGAMSDRIGARRVLTRIVLWWSAFTVVTGFVSTFWLMIGVRFLFGAGEAGAYPGAAAVIGRWFPKAERGRATSVVWMASRLGAMLSPVLVVPMQKVWGWRPTFWMFGGIGALWAVAWFLWYRDRPRDKRGVGPAELAEIESEDHPSSVHRPLPWRHLLRNRNFWKLLTTYHAYCWGSYFYISWLHTYLQKGRGMTEDQMKTWSTLPFIVGVGATVFGGWLSDRLVRSHGLRFGRRVVGTAGLVLGGLGLLAVAFAPTPQLAAVFLCVGYLGMDCFLPVSWAVALDVGGRNGGGISGAMNMAGQLGSFVSSVAFGYMVQAWGYDASLVPLALVTLVGAGIYYTVDATQPVLPIDQDAVPVTSL